MIYQLLSRCKHTGLELNERKLFLIIQKVFFLNVHREIFLYASEMAKNSFLAKNHLKNRIYDY